MAVKRSFKDMLPPAAKVTEEPVAAVVEEPAAPAPQVSAAAPVAESAAAAAVSPAPAEQAAQVQVPVQPETPEPAPAVPATEAAAPAAVPAPAQAPVSAVQEQPAPAADLSVPSGRPHYTQLVRKELRVFEDQAVDLKLLTMSLNNRRSGSGERITDNTLVRVAIDLLLQRKDQLAGASEAALRESLSLPPRY
ncbi:hypothetical protein [Arthrobacter sp. IK3]|uniref:hypothetical protein n=1 Tax=Arthrobacter sp. IK3 TaxID=3448169 RepID=UPI003EE04664